MLVRSIHAHQGGIMNHYFDIKLIPDSELSESELVSKVYTKFHKLLCDLQTDQVGISFPEVSYKLGTLFRIHASADQLQKIQDIDWLGGLKGYCQLSHVLPVPEIVQYRLVSSLRCKHNQSRLRRMVSRGNVSEEAVSNYKRKMLGNWLEQPFVDLKSTSTGQNYRKFFLFGDITPESKEGKFDRFGLSHNATIPWF